MPASRVSQLLATCIARLGPVSDITTDLVGRLSVGDREALLLHLRRLTLGARMPCVVRCAECREAIDLSVSIDEVLHPPYEEWQPEYEAQWQTERGAVRVRYRVPTGADQIAAAAIATRDLPAARALLLRRCILAIETPEGAGGAAGNGEPVCRRELPALMAARDAQAESLLEFVCPACGASGQALLDAADFFFRELGAAVGDVYRQVHELALHYHWSEAEILALPWAKRQRYLALLAGVSP